MIILFLIIFDHIISEINSGEETATGEPEITTQASTKAIIETSTELIAEATTENVTTVPDTEEGRFEEEGKRKIRAHKKEDAEKKRGGG